MHIIKIVKQTPIILLVLLTILFPAAVMATMSVTLAWDPNTEPNLAGYRLYARESGEPAYAYVEWEGTDTQCTIAGLDRYESYFFVVRAVDQDGNESGNSNEVFLPAADGVDDGDRSVDGGGASAGGGGGGGCFISSLL